MHQKFKKAPQPDAEVVQALEAALAAAKAGYVRAALVVTVNPLHKTESASAGDLSPICRTILIGALSEAAHELLNLPR